MTKTARTAECPIPKRIRKKLQVTLDPEVYDQIKNSGVNASRLIDRAVTALFSRIDPVYILVSSKEGQESVGPMRFERTTSRLSAGFSETEAGEAGDETRGEKRAESVSGNTRVFDLKDLDEYLKNAIPHARPKTIEGVSSAWKQFLGFGEVLSRKIGSRRKIEEITSRITYDTITAYNRDQNTKKSGTALGYVRTMLDYFAKKRNDPLLSAWSKSLKYTSPGTKRLFAVPGEKAAIVQDEVKADILTYYRHIIRDDIQDTLASKKPAFRNLVNLLFGITTGARVEEMSRLTWEEIDQGLAAGWFVIPAPSTKTNTERTIPIHPAIKPYLELLKLIYPDKPFHSAMYRKTRKDRNAILHLNQARNYAVKYWREYGIDEKIRIAIMGHDEGVIKKEIKKEEEEMKEMEEIKTAMGKVYGKYTPHEIANHYHSTVGKGFKPIPKEVSIKKIRENLKPFFKTPQKT